MESMATPTRARAGSDVVEEVVVKVNRLIADLVPAYLAARRTEVTEIRRKVDEGDLEALRVIGHNLRGSGAGYGFDDLTLLGAQIETAAEAGDLRTVREVADRLEAYIKRVTVVAED